MKNAPNLTTQCLHWIQWLCEMVIGRPYHK